LIALLVFLTGLPATALAQGSLYDPYAAQQTQPQAQSSQPGSAPGATIPQTGAYPTPNTAVPPTTGDGGFSPTVIQNNVSPTAQPATTPVTNPTAPAAIPPPLYARPGSTPGQFELFTRPPPEPGEFETFVAKALGAPLPRFGSSLILNGGKGFATSPTTTVPPDYRLNPGDELIIGVTGSVEADLRLTIDSEGRIFIPKVGSANVAGVRYGDLTAALTRKINEQYKQVTVSVAVGRLHGLTVYVTGQAVSPGAYTVSSLSTMVDAVLAASGPTAGGSFRTIQLRRGGELVTTLDLYDLLLKGDKSHDAILQNGDVIDIRPAGAEVALSGSVNAPAIYEAKPGETLADMIAFAGGLNSLADDTRLVVARLSDLDGAGTQQLTFAQARTLPAERGDIVRVLSVANIARPLERQAILATIDGEVDHPGRYYLAPGSTLGDLVARAGGMTSGAFVYGTDFQRASIRRQQKAGFDRAIDDVALAVAAAPLSELRGTADSIGTAQARQQSALAVTSRLKQIEPDGRIVLNLPYGASNLPLETKLEDNDRITIPAQPKTVGVFGAVYEPGSFLFTSSMRLSDYLKMAGGSQRFADGGSIFVVRANGSVVSSHQVQNFGSQPALPGDVIYVPIRTSPGAFERVREIATVVYQLGLGVATLAILASAI